MTYQYRLFYSWQSDNKEAKKTFQNALNSAVKQLKSEGFSIEIVKGGGGDQFVSIEDSVRMRIQKCDIFVGDITPVGNVSLKSKLLPNANVMYELGIATECMSADRILAVALAGDWKTEDMPFDFNHYSMILYHGDNDLDELKNVIRERIQVTDRFNKRILDRFFSERLINRNKESGKYLPEAFIENREAKDKARLFANPYKMYKLVYQTIAHFNFDYYNRKMKLAGKKGMSKLDIKEYDIDGRTIDIVSLHDIIERHAHYLKEVDKDLSNDGNYGWLFSSKIRRQVSLLESMNKRLMLIVSKAGTGKTNFLCDFAQNVLQTEEIPYLFINAYELSAENLAESLAREYNFIGSGSLEEMLLDIERFCNQHLRYLVIIIDGLNEHPKQRIFQTSLYKVIGALLHFRHVKVIMSCRKEFYDNNYKLIREAYKQELCEVWLDNTYRGGELSKLEKECVFERYEAYYNTGKTNPLIKNTLSKNLLLLRMFFETYQGQDIKYKDKVDYVELYNAYFDKLCNKIENVIRHDVNVSRVEGLPYDIFRVLLQWMIDNDNYTNIDYTAFTETLDQEQKNAFISFMNANLILKQDLRESKDGIHDVLNFTFEEMRDFLIAKYLVEEVLPNDEQQFDSFIDNHVTKRSNLAEGLERFLFLYSRNLKKDNAVRIIIDKPWYAYALGRYIWDVKEELLTKEDVGAVIAFIDSGEKFVIEQLAYHYWSPKKHKPLNLNTLVGTLKGMPKGKRDNILEKVWPSKPEGSLQWIGGPVITMRGRLMSALKSGIERRRKGNEHEEIEALSSFYEILQDSSKDVYVPIYEGEEENSVNLFGYGAYRYLTSAHKGTKQDYLKRAGVKKGFAKQMFGDIYDSVFREAIDVEELYKEYFLKEYSSLEQFISMRYSIPKVYTQQLIKAINTGDYRIIDFSGIDVGNSSFDALISDDVMCERLYNWLNWKDDENKN